MRYSVVFGIPNPPSTAVTLDRSQADSVVNAMLVSQGIQNAVLASVDICIVQPSNYWQVMHTGAEVVYQTGVARAAYVYALSVPTTRFDDGSPDTNTYIMYVDAQNAAIIGGEFDQIMALSDGKKTVQTPVPQLLESATEVRLFKRGLRGVWSKTPVAVLNTASNHACFRLLRKTTPCKNAGPLALASYKMVVIGKAKARHELQYMPSTGRIGSGHAWGIVVDQFKAWVQSLDEQAKKKKVVSAGASAHSP